MLAACLLVLLNGPLNWIVVVVYWGVDCLTGFVDVIALVLL